MAPTNRRSTGKAAPAKAGAASAVAKDESLTVESDAPVVVDSPTPTTSMEDAEAAADAEDARLAAERKIEETRDAAKAQHERRIAVLPAGTTVTEGQGPAQNAPDVVTGDTPVQIDPRQEVPSVPEPVPVDRVVNREVAEATAQLVRDSGGDEKAARDIQALRALADTAGDPVTPYGGGAPAPLPPLPPLREIHNWAREGDEVKTARVVVDGFRPRVNGGYRFARRGDRITAPRDIIDMGVKRGVLRAEEV